MPVVRKLAKGEVRQSVVEEVAVEWVVVVEFVFVPLTLV